MVEEHFPIKRMKKSNFLMISLVLNLSLAATVAYVYQHRSGAGGTREEAVEEGAANQKSASE